MITFVLHGGATSIDNENNRDFFRQFTVQVDKHAVYILLCYWARKKSEWGTLAKRDTSKISAYTKKTIATHIAKDTHDLFEHLEKTDVLYVAGGEAELLEPWHSDLKELK